MKRIVVFLAMALMAFSVAQAESEQDSTFVFGPADTETAAPELTPSPTPASTPIPADSGDSGFDFSQVDNPLATPVAVNPIDMPTPTPTPAPTPIPDTAFSARKKDLESLKKWKIDGKKVTNGLTQFELPESNSSRLIRLTGWGYVEDANFDGQHCQMYILVLDSKNRMHVYDATIAPGITGMGEHDGKGKNLSDCDFTAMIDVSSYPDGDYQVGVGIQYTSNKKTLRYGYTFGDAYRFTVVGGAVTAVNGVEH